LTPDPDKDSSAYRTHYPKTAVIYHMSLANYFFNDTFNGLTALDRLFDDVFNSRELPRAQDVNTFRPR
jgi:hypothetical protein